MYIRCRFCGLLNRAFTCNKLFGCAHHCCLATLVANSRIVATLNALCIRQVIQWSSSNEKRPRAPGAPLPRRVHDTPRRNASQVAATVTSALAWPTITRLLGLATLRDHVHDVTSVWFPTRRRRGNISLYPFRAFDLSAVLGRSCRRPIAGGPEATIAGATEARQ